MDPVSLLFSCLSVVSCRRFYIPGFLFLLLHSFYKYRTPTCYTKLFCSCHSFLVPVISFLFLSFLSCSFHSFLFPVIPFFFLSFLSCSCHSFLVLVIPIFFLSFLSWSSHSFHVLSFLPCFYSVLPCFCHSFLFLAASWHSSCDLSISPVVFLSLLIHFSLYS
jgi:hypothetical protein